MKILSNKEYEKKTNEKPQSYTYYMKDPYQTKKIEELEIQNIRLEIESDKKDKEIERLKKDNEYLNKKHEKIIHNIMEFVDKNTFNHRNTGERILTLHGKGILDLLDICLGSDKE